MKHFLFIFFALLAAILAANPYQSVEPVLEFTPISMISNYFDFNLSASAGDALGLQLDNVGGGTYYVFQARETAAATCRIYYGYLDVDYNLTALATIGVSDLHETKPALAIDSETGDPIVSWNRDDGVLCSYDLYHLGSCGLWKTPFYIIDENTYTPHPDDNFKDPIVKIGSSPVQGKRRVYILTKNYRTPTPIQGYDLALMMYADFDVNDFNIQSELNWSQNFIPDYISTTHTNICFSFAVDENLVSIIGYDNEGNVFVYENENYGEGNFDFFLTDFSFPVENPVNLDGTPRFTNDQGNPYELYLKPMFSSNSNAIIVEDENLLYPISFGLAAEQDIYPLGECLLYPKLVRFNFFIEEFSFYDLLLEGVDYNDDIPAIPWDIDEDGQVDSYDMEGKVDWIPSWPVFYHDNNPPFPDDLNNMRVVENEAIGTINIFWNDGVKAHFAENSNATVWQDKPEIVTTTFEGWNTLHDAQYLNAAVIPNLEGMIPEFFYPSTEFCDLGNGTHTMNSMFYDADEYNAPGQNNGGTIKASQIWFIPAEQNNNIGISHPTSGEIYSTGDIMEINWFCHGSSMVFKIDLIQGQNEFVLCITDDPGDDTFLWTIPDDLPADSDYQVRVMGLSPPGYYSSQLFTITDTNLPDDMINAETILYQNTPNPFNPSTTISFTIEPEDYEKAEIVIYNSKGQKIRTFCHAELVEAYGKSNNYAITWNGDDDNGKHVSSGVYLYKLVVGEYEESKKMLLLK